MANENILTSSAVEEEIRIAAIEERDIDFAGKTLPGLSLQKRIIEQTLNLEGATVLSTISLEEAILKLVEQPGIETREVLAENIQQLFGWDLEIFKQKMLKMELLADKLSNEVMKKSVLKKAQEVLTKVKSGEKSFEEFALKYPNKNLNIINCEKSI